MSDDKIVTGFFLAPTPNHMSDERIAKLFDDDFKIAEATAAMLDRVQAKAIPCNLPELFFHSPQRRRMVFDPIPVGHDIGYRCYDGDKHDAESAFTSGEFGDGMTEDEAYVDWLHNVDKPEPSPPVRYPVLYSGSGVEPPDYGNPRRAQDPDED